MGSSFHFCYSCEIWHLHLGQVQWSQCLKRFPFIPIGVVWNVLLSWTRGWFMVPISKYTTCPLVVKTRKCISLQIRPHVQGDLLSFWISVLWCGERVTVNTMAVSSESTLKVQFISLGYHTWAKLHTKQSRRSWHRHSRYQRGWNDESLERLADGKAIRPWRRFALSERPSGSEWNVCCEFLYSLTHVTLIHFSILD